MENSNKIIPPHLNAEVYRTDTTGTDTLPYLDYIHCHSDGSMIIGSSELTGRYWNGGVSIFKRVVETQKSHNNNKKNIFLPSGTADGCFIGNSVKVLICEDRGAVSVWTTNNDVWNDWIEDVSAAEHDDAVLAVDCLDNEKEYVTVGADGNVKVWDVNEMICIRNYSLAHTNAICGVAVRHKSITNFATGSLDRYITIWDENIDKPVLDLIRNVCGIRCLQWLDENKLLFGDEAGVLNLVDVRKPETALKLMEFPAAVHRLAIHPKMGKVAVCCDNKIVTVCDVSVDAHTKVIYHDRHSHNNYVRGIAWNLQQQNELHTVGWDSVIKTHHIE